MFLLLTSASNPVAADAPRSRVAVVRSESNDRLLRDASTRLRAELDGAGFEVVEVDRPPGDPRVGVEAAAGASGSFATVSLNRASFGAFADIWISDQLTGKTVVRRLEVGQASNAATVLAIRALELLRASLLEVREPPAESEPAREPPRDVLAWVAPAVAEDLPPAARTPWEGAALSVSAVALRGTDGLGFAFGPSLRVSYGFERRFFARVSLAGPLLGSEPARSEGKAAVRQEYASVDLGVSTLGRTLAAFAWIGAGAFHLHTTGSSADGFRARSDDVGAFLSTGGVGGMVRLGARTALCAELGVTLLVPHPVVVIAQKDSGSAGVPSLSLALGAIVGL